ncbi:DMT family transporter [Alkalihalobacillus sp. BA299]|uniref:DMT family transporter n=1 Tax=Alkalihalobacillus sp. BA299 TaxID=2815938 RepID=UPI0027DCEB59|nr:DMT family transporter [Alkalihalobacillus sp. BA299]
MKKYQVWIMLILATLFWAGNFVFGSFVVTEIDPVWMTFSRWFFALFLLFPIAHFLEKPNWKLIKKDWPYLILVGVLGIIGYNLILYSALEYTTSINASLVAAMNPGVIVVASVILLKEKLSKAQILGFCISLAGAIIILTQGEFSRIFQFDFNKGDLLMVGAIVVWTFYSIIGKRLTLPPITATAVSTLFAILLLAPFVLSQGLTFYSDLSPLALTGIVYFVIFPSVCSFIFWNVAVREIGASQSGIFLNLIPVFTAIISVLLGNMITLVQILGGLFVFIGVYLTTGLMDQKLSSRWKKAALRKSS